MTDTPQTNRANTPASGGPSPLLAFEDIEFLRHPDLRPVRLQLELLKPEWHLRQNGINSTVVVFGSARIPSPEIARQQLDELVGQDDGESLARARARVDLSRYYEEARRFAGIVTRRFQTEARRDFVIVTGGGPGIMEAANRGADEAGGRSIGFNITLPHEQAPNPFITEDLSFRFHYFAIRKMHLLLRARGLVVFPGGYGTLDELFEALTLIQTNKLSPIPVVLVGADFWHRTIDFGFLVEQGLISQEETRLFRIVEDAQGAVDALVGFYGGVVPNDLGDEQHPAGSGFHP
ncbi:MAG: LOG family protein [Planctomycetes bacterium]|nr:LOG family protein [Polyangiaceae bacterium]MCB9910021.1 LOG family protein [Planctomycetota bacterium]